MESPTASDRTRVVTGSGKANGLPLIIWVVIGVVVLLALTGGAALIATGKVSLQLPGAAKTTAPAKVLTPAQQLTTAQTELQQASTPQEKVSAYQHIGEAYLNMNSSQQAGQAAIAFQSALSSQPSSQMQISLLAELMSSYAAAGDTANEIATIQKIIPLLKQSSKPADQHLANRYQEFLNRLQAGAKT